MPVLFKSTIINPKGGGGGNKGGGQGAGGGAILNFVDTFVRADKETPGPNWMRFLAHGPSGNGVSCAGFSRISSNNFEIRATGQLNPTVFYDTAFMPAPIYASNYNLDKTLVESTGNTLAGAFVAGMALRFNVDLRTGIGIRNYDCYFIGWDGAIQRRTSTGTTSILASQGWAFGGGNKVRCRVSGNGSSVFLETFLNGTPGNTVTDSDATRILNGSPGLIITTAAGDTTLVSVKLSRFEGGAW